MNVKFEFIYLDIIYTYACRRDREKQQKDKQNREFERKWEEESKEVKERTQVEQFN